MGKNKGPLPCNFCDRTFASIVGLQQHVRDKHLNAPTQPPIVEAQSPAQQPQPPVQQPKPPAQQPKPPVQQPQVQVRHDPVTAPAASSSDTTTCEHCLATFSSLDVLKQHKIRFHSWRCFKCPTLPPFENGPAWQRHFREDHTQPSAAADTEGKAATTTEEDKPQSVLSDPERSKGSRSEENNGQHRIEVHNVATRLEPSPSRVANVNQPVTSGPLLVVASSVIQHGPVPCTLCDRTFASIADMQQHIRDKRHDTPTREPPVAAQPPAQQPQTQVQYEQGAVMCEQCFDSFPSSKALKQIAYHNWRCFTCPTLPSFEDEAAWRIHFIEVHTPDVQSGTATGKKWKKVATTIEEDKSQRRIEVHNVATRLEPSPSIVANVNQPVTSGPLPVVASSVIQHGPVPCTLCDRTFASKVGVQQHVLEQHKIAYHNWRCFTCPTLPSFEDEAAWQMHFNKVHAAGVQSSAVTNTKGKGVATAIKEDKPQFVLSDPERSKGFHSGEINGQHLTEAHRMAARLGPSPSSVANVNQPIISGPLPEVVASSVIQDEVVSPASDDKVCKSRKPALSNLTRSNLGFLTSKATLISEDQTIPIDERDLLSSKGQTLNVLVEIDSEPHRGRDDTTYEIASDVLSPTPSVSSIETDEPEEEDDVEFPSYSFELQGDINVPPRGPKPGDRRGPAMSNTIVAENLPGGEPNVQAREVLGGITPSTTREQYEVARSDPPTSTTSSSRDMRWDLNQGDSPHDPLRTRRSKTGSATATPSIHFECRICLSDPTPSSNLTATLCGHLFCYECIATDVLRTSRCPVCKNVLALYCLFKLDVVS